MSRRRAYLVALAAFVIGAIAGGLGAWKFWDGFTNRFAAGFLAAEASSTVRHLERIRGGDTTGAVELLEIKLDGALVGLGAFIPEIPASRRDHHYLKTIEIARDYRASFPRTNESEPVSDAVAKAFTLLGTQPDGSAGSKSE